MKGKIISKNQLQRLPFYLSYLKNKYNEGVEYISSPQIAAGLGLSEEQVRKDLALISRSCGKPKMGRSVETLILDLEEYLGYRNTNKAIIVGAGHLGCALLAYQGFAKYGLDIVAAFDNREDLPESISGVPIYPLEQMSEVVTKLNVSIGIITVPAGAAQSAADGLIAAGVKGIWNFTPICLHTPERVKVRHEDLASSLAVLSHSIVTGNL